MTPRLLALLPLAVGINLAMSEIVAFTGLPVYLDTVGTVLVAALVGLVPALITGLLSQVTMTLMLGNSMWLAFLPVQLAVALLAAFAVRRAGFNSWASAAVWGLAVGLVAATMAWPIAYAVFGGVTATGTTAIATVLNQIGTPLGLAVYLASLSTDLADKLITFLVVRTLLKSLPIRLAARFPEAARALGTSG
ncbi:MAG: ECF transporter S component [Gemmatimonadales bacterium]